MPIYEYVCESCGNEEEVIHKISEKPEMLCDHCAGKDWRKKASMSAFHLKGGGWYKDGYGSGKEDIPANISGPSNTDGKAPADAKTSSEGGTADKATNSSGSADQTSTKTDNKTPAASPSTASTPKADKPAPSKDQKAS